MSPDSTADDGSKDSLVGTVVAGRYRIISRLGQGGMGVTYRAWDLETGRPVVLKHPQSEFFAKPGFLERFGREARMMASLSHPNVVHVTTVGEHDGIPYLVMPFLPGGSLANRRLRDDSGQPKPMHPSTLHLWLPQVAEALDYVHSQGVVHRDVKPGNVFFDAFWHASLGDFGISKIVEETSTLEKEHTLTATSIAVGTQEYMAPEMFSPKPKIDGRIDQYALAVMAYETLAGRRPFTGDTAHVIVEITTRNVPPLAGFRRDLPPSLEQAVATGLAKHTGDRFPTCRDLARSILADVPPMQDEPDVARLLCPQCENMLKLPTAAAGRKGRCPRCSNQMMVADDLGALWLTNEEAGGTNSKASRASTASTDSPPQEPRRKLPRDSDSWQVLTPGPNSGETPTQRRSERGWSGTLSPIQLTAIAATACAVLFAEAVLVYDWTTSHSKKAIAATQAKLTRVKKHADELAEANAALKTKSDELGNTNKKLQNEKESLAERLARLQERPLAVADTGTEATAAPDPATPMVALGSSREPTPSTPGDEQLPADDDLDTRVERVEAEEKGPGPSGSPLPHKAGDFVGRTDQKMRHQLAQTGGGTPQSEAAIEAALKWFIQHQLPDGSWSFDLRRCPSCQGQCTHSDGKGAKQYALIGPTAMAILPFLGRGYTHKDGPYKRQIEQALTILMTKVVRGKGDAGEGSYVQGLTGICLSEAYAMTQDRRLRGPAQSAIAYVSASQDPVGGGWGYSPKSQGDTSIAGWSFMALKSGHIASLTIDPRSIKGTAAFLDSVQSDEGSAYGYREPGNSPALNAVGLLCRMYLGWKKDHPALNRGADRLTQAGPNSNLYYDYYGTQVLHHIGGERWVSWNSRMRDLLVKTQAQEGHEKGSWFDGVNGGHGPEIGGRIYCTSLATMILEVYYRHLPLYDAR